VRDLGGTVVELISYEGAIVGGLARNGKLTLFGKRRLHGCGELLLAMRNARVCSAVGETGNR
jgi:hypothetical protein